MRVQNIEVEVGQRWTWIGNTLEVVAVGVDCCVTRNEWGASQKWDLQEPGGRESCAKFWQRVEPLADVHEVAAQIMAAVDDETAQLNAEIAAPGSSVEYIETTVSGGLTKREYFAAMFAQAMCAGEGAKMVAARDERCDESNWDFIVVSNAVNFADALIAALASTAPEATAPSIPIADAHRVNEADDGDRYNADYSGSER